MYKKFRSIIYAFDIIGSTPQLLIFNNSRYKSTFSSIASILIILFSVAYTAFSLMILKLQEVFKLKIPFYYFNY